MYTHINNYIYVYIHIDIYVYIYTYEHFYTDIHKHSDETTGNFLVSRFGPRGACWLKK